MRVTDTAPATRELALSLGLTSDEYGGICKRLERTPVFAELGIFSAMYSEHCSYKSSKKYLKRFPTHGKRVLQGPGENAGILDIGEGWAVAFKMESHNHPSYIEPYQGAATGVGGILRDIFTMGARPIGSMDGLFFGSMTFNKTRSLVKGIVRGIGDYGNAVGVPTIAGQTLFHSSFNQNPLVNAFTLGLVKKEHIYRGVASGIGNVMVYVGAKTGRDGVHGATMASKEFSSDKELDRPTVQVGDPFTEKLLLEATLEAMRNGLISGIQDMGAAGLTSSSFEMAGRANTGLELNLDVVPMREPGMTAYELLLSESQERMLLTTSLDKVEKIKQVFAKWDLHAECIGSVVEGHRVRMQYRGETVVDLPVDLVVNPPLLDRPSLAPSDLRQRWFMDGNRLLSANLDTKFQAVMEDLNFADATPLASQYDSMVGNRSLDGHFEDAALLRLREIEERNVQIALSMDCNPRVSWLSPREGGRRAVAEAAVNVAVRGAEPIGITDCLNFGSPENPEVMWQFGESIEGISEACEALGIPVVSGNVSFYNDTDGKPIYPSPMIGMVGLRVGTLPPPRSSFFSTQLELALLGPKEGGLGGSALASQWFKRECGKPEDTDLKLLQRTIKFLLVANQRRWNLAAHDVSDGGIAVAAAEMVLHSKISCLGLELTIPRDCNSDAFLFGETLPRILLAYEASEHTEIETLAFSHGLDFTIVGQTTDTALFSILQGGAKVLEYEVNSLRTRWSHKWVDLF